MNSSTAKIGYARTSTTDQTLDAQVAALEAAGCGMIRREQKSGASLAGRPEPGRRMLRTSTPSQVMVMMVPRPRPFKVTLPWPCHNLIGLWS